MSDTAEQERQCAADLSCDVHVLIDYRAFQNDPSSSFANLCSISLHLCASLGVQQHADPALSAWQGRLVDGSYAMGTRQHWSTFCSKSGIGAALLSAARRELRASMTVLAGGREALLLWAQTRMRARQGNISAKRKLI